MNKKKLLSLRTLNATDKMMELAKEDMPRAAGWNGQEHEYKYGMYLRCQQLSGILKISIFFCEELKQGITEAYYDLFCNPEGDEWITYDRREETWKTAKLDMLYKPSYVYYSGKYMNPEGIRAIKHILKVQNGGYRGILSWQLKIREDELKQKHRRETDPWDMKQEQVPELPRDWDKWVNKGGCKYNFIFYTYERKGAKTGYCTNCEKEVPISNPRHNKSGICKKCGKKITFKSRGKAGTFHAEWKNSILQKCEDGMVLRVFNSWRRFDRGEYEKSKTDCYEIERVFYDYNLHAVKYDYEDYKYTGHRWVEKGIFSGYYGYSYSTAKAIVYKRTIPNLTKGILARTGLDHVIKEMQEFDIGDYLDEVKKNPDIETLAKAGMTKLAIELAEGNAKGYPKMKLLKEQRDLHKKMGITKEQMRIMRKRNLGAWAWSNYIKYKNMPEDIAIILDNWKTNVEGSQYKVFSLTGLPLNKMVRYLERQRIKNGYDPKQILGYYRDYLSMAKERGMDLQDDIVRLQPDMMKYHNRYVEEKEREKNEKRYAEVNKKFKQIARDYLKNKALFEYQDKNYIVLIPRNAADIVREGQLQHHCVGSSDTYMKSMNERKTFIVFLRKKSDPEKPYYTVEIKHDARVLQSYAAYDRQPDLEKVKKFEEKWIVEVNKRIKEDKKQPPENIMEAV